MDLIIYTKHDCERCAALKTFLEKNKIVYIEKDIDTEEVAQELVQSQYIIENFCDEEKCIVITPIVKIGGTWINDDLFNTEGFNEEKAKGIFNRGFLKKIPFS